MSFAALLSLCAASARAQEQRRSQPPAQTVDLASVNIEDLMNIKVTSVSKNEQTLSQTAAAIFVIAQSDIASSGATNIPNLLRMVPGIDVAQINASTWAISARGFNQEPSDKLLVLIDGRTVYSPIYSAVYWDAEQVPLENIDRIEVTRGPGASVWGANAVDGVISIVTKRADQSQGGSVTVAGGTNPQGFGTVSYGGKLGGAAYRISSDYSDYNHLEKPSGRSGGDAWDFLRADFRADDQLSAKDSLTVGMSAYSGAEDETVSTITAASPVLSQVLELRARLSEWDLQTDWNHVFSSSSDTSLKVYFDRADRNDPTYALGINTFDIDFQHHFKWAGQQDIVWGLGYLGWTDGTKGSPRIAFTPADRTDSIFSSFLQDEIAIRPEKVHVTIGAKLEHNSFTGFTLQPTVRIAWIANKHAMAWSSFSVADRTPSISDVNARYTGNEPSPPGTPPILITLFGNPQEKNETLYATEIGYRQQFGTRFSLDLTGFFNHYARLRSYELRPPSIVFTPPPLHLVEPIDIANLLSGETHGAEAEMKWKVSNRWTLSPGYAFLAMHLHRGATSQDVLSVPAIEGGSPTHQAQLRSQLVLPSHLEFDISTFFVGPLPALSLPSYTRLDAGINWHGGERVSFGLFGQNLLQDHHLETDNGFGEQQLVQSNLIKRSAYAKLTWRF